MVKLSERQTKLLRDVAKTTDDGEWFNAEMTGFSLVRALTEHKFVEASNRFSPHGNWYELQITTAGREWLEQNKRGAT